MFTRIIAENRGGGIFQNPSHSRITSADKQAHKIHCSDTADMGKEPVSASVFCVSGGFYVDNVSGQGRNLAQWVKGDFDRLASHSALPTTLYSAARYAITIK